MKRLIFLFAYIFVFSQINAQKPCVVDPLYRQFDFWIGEWDVFGKNGQKSGDSKISVILDSCVILEEWTSAQLNQRIVFTGKSFNSYNRASRQWQQTWVDNTGGSTEFLKGKFENHKMVFQSDPFNFNKDTMAVRRLSFYHLSPEKVRQHGEISKDKGKSWATEYDLEYRRRK